MSEFNTRIRFYKTGTDEEISKGIIFNFDTLDEIEQFKIAVIQAHQVIINTIPLKTVTILGKQIDYREYNQAKGITGDDL